MSALPFITLVRHGETEWSANGRHTGRTDLPLTANGEAAARGLAAKLAGTKFDTVLVSPLTRAVRTCELAGFRGEADPDFMEWNYGDFEGLTSVEIKKTRPDWLLFRDGCPGGESVAEMTARVDRAVAKLKAATGNVLVVAHGHLLRVLAARWCGQPLPFAQHLLLGTATISALHFDHHNPDEPAISKWNCG